MASSSINTKAVLSLSLAAAATAALSVYWLHSAAAFQSAGSASPPSGAPHEPKKKVKTVEESSVSYCCKISPEHCDEHGRVYGGELLKLIDVAAGVVAAKFAGGQCLTISADRVIFLQEIKVSDLVHLSVAVNRAWGSSMEIGVRVTRETMQQPGVKNYCCHAYLTFVTRPPPKELTPSLPPRPFLSFLQPKITPPSPPKRLQLPQLLPLTLLEQRRYLLAGRRRSHRIQRHAEAEKLLSGLREEFLEIEKEEKELEREEEGKGKGGVVGEMEKEVLVDAWERLGKGGDEEVKVIDGWVVAQIANTPTPIRYPLEEIERASAQKGKGGYRRLTVTRTDSSSYRGGSFGDGPGRYLEDHSPIDMKDTLVMCLWIVRLQHCNSKSILFGGTLMRWIEETSSIAARRVSPRNSNGLECSWSSAGIDGLSFRSPVLPGEVVYVRAAVLKVWDSSAECYALAIAEDRNSPNPTTRLVSEAFFTLVAIDPVSGRPLKGQLRSIHVPEGGSAEKVVAGAERRRDERLLDKRVLTRVYA